MRPPRLRAGIDWRHGHNPIDSNPEAVKAYWNTRAPNFDKIHPRLTIFQSLLQSLPPFRTLLDVGCGPGTLRQLLPDGVTYFGVDIAADVINAQHDPTHFEVADLDRNPACFSGRTFDVVVCSGIVEYLRHLDQFLDFVVAKLAPRGHLIISYTNHQHFGRDRLRWLRGTFAHYRDPHVTFMRVPTFRRLLVRHRLTVSGHMALTRDGDMLGFPWHVRYFPLNALARQFIFLCQRHEGGGR